MKTMLKLIAILLPIVAQAEITSGWCQTTNGSDSSHPANIGDFFATENWVDGQVNGYFGPGLPALFQYGTFSQDYTGTFTFAYTGDYTTLTFGSDSTTPRTVYLTDDFIFQPALTEGKGKVVFGNKDSRKNINFNLGGARNFCVKYNILNFYSAFVNGDINLIGDGATMNINGPAYVEGSVNVSTNANFTVGFMTGDKEDRLGNVTLTRANLSYFKPDVASVTDTIGVLTVKADAGAASSLQWTSNNKAMSLTMAGLNLEKGAILAVQQDGTLGATSHVKFTDPVETIGGVVPGLVVGASPTATLNGAPNENYTAIVLAKYDAESGLAAMKDEDFASAVSSEEDVNLRIAPGETVEIAGESSVNSIILNATKYRDWSAKITGADTLKVKSGMILGMGVKDGAKLDVPVDFGNKMGYLITGGSESTSIDVTKPIYGQNGVVLTRLFKTTGVDATSKLASSYAGITIAIDSDEGMYTGDTYIQGPVKMGTSPFLPHGSRTGDVYLNGSLQADNVTINGLYGNGRFERTYSTGKTLTLGDNNANGDFAGTIILVDSGATLTKIGTGTQRFGGTLTLEAAINVSSGTVVLDGSVEQGVVNVAAGAKLGGSGVVKTSVAFAEGAKLALKVEGKTLAAPLTVAAVSGTAIVEADGSWKGEACVLKAADGRTLEGATFVKGENVASLRLSADKTELYASPKAKGFAISIM